jgi:hypothetical protein
VNRTLAAFLAVVVPLSTACDDVGGWTSETIDLGISVDLSAVTEIGWGSGSGYLAVGSSGTILYWDHTAPKRDDRFVRVMDLGDHDLHALVRLWDGYMVVGDGGTAAIGEGDARSWTPLDVGVSADLHAIVPSADGLLLVGDGVVVRMSVEGEWTEIPPPDGGWGQLRAGIGTYGATYLIGLDGVIWAHYEEEPASPWIAEWPGTSADLFDIDIPGESETPLVVGANGTFLRGSFGSWVPIDTGLTADLIRLHDGMLLTAEGELFEVDAYSGVVDLSKRWTHPGALDFAHAEHQIGIVGSDGLALDISFHMQEPW